MADDCSGDIGRPSLSLSLGFGDGPFGDDTSLRGDFTAVFLTLLPFVAVGLADLEVLVDVAVIVLFVFVAGLMSAICVSFFCLLTAKYSPSGMALCRRRGLSASFVLSFGRLFALDSIGRRAGLAIR